MPISWLSNWFVSFIHMHIGTKWLFNNSNNNKKEKNDTEIQRIDTEQVNNMNSTNKSFVIGWSQRTEKMCTRNLLINMSTVRQVIQCFYCLWVQGPHSNGSIKCGKHKWKGARERERKRQISGTLPTRLNQVPVPLDVICNVWRRGYSCVLNILKFVQNAFRNLFLSREVFLVTVSLLLRRS